jgi:glycerol-3-phosphate O-acyltransferase/dihydroxyacetone phosphate acyltransferase
VLYSILKPLIKVSLKAFFRKIEVIGTENLALDGPIIFVSNHPNAFLDALILVISQKPELHFIAGAEWFGKGFKNYVFREEFNMIPVVRPWLKKKGEAPAAEPDVLTNDEMFEQCYISLCVDKRIVIYPEGTSVTVPKIRALKTGASRIKVGADRYMKAAGMDKEVKIIPVGVNYYNPRTFQSDVILNVGAPIDFSDIKEEDPKELVKVMTDRMHQKMSELVFHFEAEDFTAVAKKVYRILGPKIKEKFDVDDADRKQKYLLHKKILDSVYHFFKSEPETFAKTLNKIDTLTDQVAEQKLDFRFLGDQPFPFVALLKLTLGLPFFLLGLVLNVVPYSLTRWVFESKLRPKFATTYDHGKLNPSFLGSMAFLLAMVLFAVWYVLLIVGALVTSLPFFLLPVLVIGAYLLGVFAARYAKLFFDFKQNVLVVNRRRKHSAQYQEIQKSWVELVDELQVLSQQYRDRH